MKKYLTFLSLAIVSGTWPLLAQGKPCQSSSFSATVSGTDRYTKEIGYGLWITVYPDSLYPGGSWTVRIGEGDSPKERFDLGWSLARAWNPEWELGPAGIDAETAMKLSPRQLWFAVSYRDLRRLREAQFRQTSSDSRIAFSGESDPDKVIEAIPKGLASVRISDYRLSEPKKDGRRAILAITFAVTITVPADFPLLGGVPNECVVFKPPLVE